MPSAHALALGELTVSSHIGQYLEAEIELLSIEAGQGDLLIARLADKALYTQFGIPRADVLSDLRFVVDNSDPNNAVVRIQSSRPINEPFLNLLLAIEGPSGTIIREVAILLDPMVFAPRSSTASSVNGGQPEARAGSESLDSLPIADTLPMAETFSVNEPALGAASIDEHALNHESVVVGEISEIWVNRGDTLMALAAAVAPPGVTVSQATVALYRENPSAFRGSIHRMRHSVSLRVPPIEAMTSISRREARAAIRMPAATNSKTATADSNNAITSAESVQATVSDSSVQADVLVEMTQSGSEKGDWVDEGGNDWSEFFDVGVIESPEAALQNEPVAATATESSQSGSSESTAVTNSAINDARLLATVLPADTELTEMRGIIADLKIVLDGLDTSVAEKISQLETMDVRVVELQATFNRLQSQIKLSANEAIPTAVTTTASTDANRRSDDNSGAAPKSAQAEAAQSDSVDADVGVPAEAAPAVSVESSASEPANPEQVEDIEALAAVLLDPVAIETARENGNLAELVEKAKETALLEAIDRGAVNQEPVAEAIPDALLNDSDREAVENNMAGSTSAAGPAVVAASGDAATSGDVTRKPVGVSDEVWRGVRIVFGQEADVEKIRQTLLNGGLVVIAGTLFAFLYRRWSWRREVRIMEEELDENRPVDTSNTLAYYHSTLDVQELQEESLKDALRKNRAAHDVRLQLLRFYAAKHNVTRFGDCARDMYRLTRGRVPEWQHVIEMGLKLDPNMQFYDVDENESAEACIIQRSEIQEAQPEVPPAAPIATVGQANSNQGFQELDSFGTATLADKAPLASLDADEGIEANNELNVDPTIDEHAELEVHFHDESLAEYAENNFAADKELDSHDFGDDLSDSAEHASQRDFTETIDLVEQYAAVAESSVDLDLFDDSEDVSVKSAHLELDAAIADDGDDEQNPNSLISEEMDADQMAQDDSSLAGSLHESLDDLSVTDVSKNDAVSLQSKASNEDVQGSDERVVDEGTQRDMELKLVLARAYIDNRFLGEARALLNEVLEKGATNQQIQAELLMQELRVKQKNRAS